MKGVKRIKDINVSLVVQKRLIGFKLVKRGSNGGQGRSREINWCQGKATEVKVGLGKGGYMRVKRDLQMS